MQEEQLPQQEFARQEQGPEQAPVAGEGHVISPDDNTVFVGRKPPMSYVTAVVTRFNNGISDVKLKARGKSICLAVDVTQIVKHKFFPTLKIDDVLIDTEELPSEDGRMSRVSSMTIFLSK